MAGQRNENCDHCNVLPLGAAFCFGGHKRAGRAYVTACSRLDQDECDRVEDGPAFGQGHLWRYRHNVVKRRNCLGGNPGNSTMLKRGYLTSP